MSVPLTDEELAMLGRRMKYSLLDQQRAIRDGMLDLADLLPFLRAAACAQGATAERFGLNALNRGDRAAILWALLDAEAQFAAYVNRCHRVAQLEAELRDLRETTTRSGD